MAHAVLGAAVSLPGGRDFLTARYEHGSGGGTASRLQHLVGAVGWEHALLRNRIFAGTELRFIRVGDVEENLLKFGLGLVPVKWCLLEGGYYLSILGGEGTETWTARSDLNWRGKVLSLGFTRSEDTVDLSSLGRRRDSGLVTDEFRLGLTFPVGRHGLTLAASRFESRFQQRYTLGFTLRWALPDSG